MPDASDVLRLICKVYHSISPYTKLVPTTYIARELGIERKEAQKLVKELKERGLVYSGCESCYDELSEKYYIVRGFTLTKQGKETEISKEEYEKEEKIRKEIYGF